MDIICRLMEIIWHLWNFVGSSVKFPRFFMGKQNTCSLPQRTVLATSETWDVQAYAQYSETYKAPSIQALLNPVRFRCPTLESYTFRGP